MEIKLDQITRKLTAKVTKEAASRAFRAANQLLTAEKEVLSGQRSGRVYRKPHTLHAMYQASAPGEPPAVRTGTFRRSWRPITGQEANGTGLTVKTAIFTGEGAGKSNPYPQILEHGSPHGMIAPRPFEKPIKDKAMPEIKKIYEEPYLS